MLEGTDRTSPLSSVRRYAGVALIADAQHEDRGIHGRLHVTGVTGNRAVDRILRITGLRPLLDVHDDLQTLLDTLPQN